jgi:hypothetical protein
MMVMFVGVYYAYSPNGSGTFPWLLVGGVLALLIGLLVVAMIVHTRRARAFLAEQHDGLSALPRGEFTRARDVFLRWSESTIVGIAALSRHNLAWTFMREGKLAHAIAVETTNIDRYAQQLAKTAMLPTAIVDLALFHALRGELDEADKHLLDLDKRSDLRHVTGYPAMNALCRGVVLCRRGDARAAAKLLSDQWGEAETTLTGDCVRLIRVVRAFAIASADSRDTGKAETLVQDSRPVYRGEFDFLGVEWPEMATFLATHKLA